MPSRDHNNSGGCLGAASSAPARPTLAQDAARPQTPHGSGLLALRVRDATPWPKASTSICGETKPSTSRLQQPALNNTCRLRHGPRVHTHRRHTCPKTDMPQPGDHSPCVPCLSFVHAFAMPAGVCDVGVWASACVRVWVHGCLCVRAHVCACTHRRDYPRTSMLSR